MGRLIRCSNDVEILRAPLSTYELYLLYCFEQGFLQKGVSLLVLSLFLPQMAPVSKGSAHFSETAVGVLIAYEYILTLQPEIRYIWKRKWSGATVLFLANRYLLWVEQAFLLYIAFGETDTVNECKIPSLVRMGILAVHRICIGLFCGLRVYAIWNRNWRAFSLVLSIYITSTSLFLSASSMNNFKPIGPPMYGCKQTARGSAATNTRLQLATMAVTTLSDITVLLLTIARTVTVKLESRKLKLNTPVTSLLLRDGTVCFILLLSLSTLDIFALERGSSSLHRNVINFILPLRSIVISRTFLSLRQVFLRKETSEISFSVSQQILPSKLQNIDMQTVVGNLGAPLRLDGLLYTSSAALDEDESDVIVISRHPFTDGLGIDEEGDVIVISGNLTTDDLFRHQSRSSNIDRRVSWLRRVHGDDDTQVPMLGFMNPEPSPEDHRWEIYVQQHRQSQGERSSLGEPNGSELLFPLSEGDWSCLPSPSHSFEPSER